MRHEISPTRPSEISGREFHDWLNPNLPVQEVSAPIAVGEIQSGVIIIARTEHKVALMRPIDIKYPESPSFRFSMRFYTASTFTRDNMSIAAFKSLRDGYNHTYCVVGSVAADGAPLEGHITPTGDWYLLRPTCVFEDTYVSTTCESKLAVIGSAIICPDAPPTSLIFSP